MLVKDQTGFHRVVMMYKFSWSKCWCSSTVHGSQLKSTKTTQSPLE